MVCMEEKIHPFWSSPLTVEKEQSLALLSQSLATNLANSSADFVLGHCLTPPLQGLQNLSMQFIQRLSLGVGIPLTLVYWLALGRL